MLVLAFQMESEAAVVFLEKNFRFRGSLKSWEAQVAKKLAFADEAEKFYSNFFADISKKFFIMWSISWYQAPILWTLYKFVNTSVFKGNLYLLIVLSNSIHAHLSSIKIPSNFPLLVSTSDF